ncbi:SDR family oxidoreductase [Herbaspirillum rhizosphaerae]|uniref:SDR family oxidoreductase n=1 Tax=Herbaspirillum rhizosphaerae TaxID=346179 RepID=UPI00067BC319|nr:SDR family oxidoreductase [Herbaspirillum rhizosphaerae]
MNQPAASKIALVTGAGSGIGLAVAQALLSDDFTVILAGRRREVLEEAVATAQAAGRHAVAMPVDIRDPASVDALFENISASFGRLDVLFNNAGVNAPAIPFDELTVDQWKNVIDTNLTGAFLCARGAFRLMRQQSPQGGRIINNGSISAHTPRPLSSAYTSSKHAVTGLTKSIALDGRPYNIVCSQIDVGNALTSLSARMTKGVLQANGSTATEPMMDVQHVADAVRYMASLPLSANVLNLTVMASNMPFVGRG